MSASSIIIGLWIASFGSSILVGRSKGRGWEGALLGFFFGLIGLLIIAVWPPTAAKQAERDRQLAGAIAQRTTVDRGPVVETAASSQARIQRAQRDKRRAATAEALSRDPSLGENTDPATLERLRLAVDQILIEQQTLADLRAVKAAAERDQPGGVSHEPRPFDEDDAVPEHHLDRRERRPPLSNDMRARLRDNPPPRIDPGWYIDPLDDRKARQWNGSNWTGALRDIV